MATTSQGSIQGMFDALQFDLDRLRAMFGYSSGAVTQQASANIGTVRTRRTVRARRRTSAHAKQTTQAQPQVVQGTQQVKPKRHLSAAARRKLSAAGKARWAQRRAGQVAA